MPAKPAAAVKVPLSKLTSLFGLGPKDPKVVEVLKTCGTVSVKSDFIIAKEAGFDFAISQTARSKTSVLSTLFLFSEGADKHRGFIDLPKGFSFSTREQLHSTVGAPASSWVIGEGEVPVTTPEVHHDTWTVGPLAILARYRDGNVRHLTVKQTDDDEGEALHCNPLHFETRPADAPEGATQVGAAVLLAWATRRFGAGSKLPAAVATKIAKRSASPRALLLEACPDGLLTTLELPSEPRAFLRGYINRLFDDTPARAAASKEIATLLTLPEGDRRFFDDDFLATFSKPALASAYYVPDDWSAVDRLAPVLDARFDDFTATGFKTAPNLAGYRKAATARDKVSVTPWKATRQAAGDLDAAPLVGLLGQSLTDKQVKATLTAAQLPIGKRSDQQANPALGLGYSAGKRDLGGKRVLVIESVSFYAKGVSHYVGGLGATVSFLAFTGELPRGLSFSQKRDAVHATLGTPDRPGDDFDHWNGPPRIFCRYKGQKLAEVSFMLPKA